MSFVLGGPSAPRGWAFCNGDLMMISQNLALFSLLGTTYGGNGSTTFGLPNLKARTPIHMGAGHIRGERGGEQSHTLSLSEIPTHIHAVAASNVFTSPPGTSNPNGQFLGGANNVYHSPANLTPMSPAEVTTTGGSQAHQNMQPFLTLVFCIALQGIFPSPN
jgi:microcystin-dependent protein